MIDARTARNAHGAVASALKRGLLVRGRCEVCGEERVEAHHDDYSRPLDIRWLCRTHHRRLHGRHRSDVDWRTDGSVIATFKLPADEYERLEQVARDEERSVSAVLRLALRDYLESREEMAA